MNTTLKNEKGITVVEIMVALAMTGLIITAIGSFMTVNMKGYNSTKSSVNLQYEAQLIMNMLIDTLMEVSDIKLIQDQENDEGSINLLEEVKGKLGKVVFIIPRKGSDGNKREYEVTLYREDGTQNLILKNEEISPEGEILTNRLKELTIESVDGKTLKTCKGIRINLVLENEEQEMTIRNEVKFRNGSK
jgi:type II secretory pathway component PulJ